MGPLWLAVGVVLTASDGREKLVVLEIVPGDESTRRTAKLVEEQLLTELSTAGRYDVAGQSELLAVLGIERQKQLLGCSDNQGSCLAEIGGALGARWLVMGTVGRFGSKLRLDLKLIDATSGRAVRREGRVLDHDDELFPAVNELLGRLVQAHDESASGGARSPLPFVVGGAGVAGAAGGVVLMVLGSSFGAGLNAKRADYTFDEAARRMRDYQAMYWAGTALVAVGVAVLAGAVVALVRAPRSSVEVVAGSGGTLEVRF
jgi:TolB-like protein